MIGSAAEDRKNFRLLDYQGTQMSRRDGDKDGYHIAFSVVVVAVVFAVVVSFSFHNRPSRSLLGHYRRYYHRYVETLRRSEMDFCCYDHYYCNFGCYLYLFETIMTEIVPPYVLAVFVVVIVFVAVAVDVVVAVVVVVAGVAADVVVADVVVVVVVVDIDVDVDVGVDAVVVADDADFDVEVGFSAAVLVYLYGLVAVVSDDLYFFRMDYGEASS